MREEAPPAWMHTVNMGCIIRGKESREERAENREKREQEGKGCDGDDNW
jgi:hypothetical protein